MVKPVGRYWVFVAETQWGSKAEFGMNAFKAAFNTQAEYEAFIIGYRSKGSYFEQLHVWDSETGEIFYELD